MCGIRLLVVKQQPFTIDASPPTVKDYHEGTRKNINKDYNLTDLLSPLTLKRRGPDGIGEQCLQQGNRRVLFQASVLQLRDTFVAQPVFQQPPFVAWNGELYQQQQQIELLDENNEHSNTTVQEVWQDHVSDTTLFADAIRSILSQEGDEEEDPIRIMNKIAHYCSLLVNAEYAFCVVTNNHAYYGRDPLGRRSLLVHHHHPSQANDNHAPTGDYYADNDSVRIAFELASVATDATRVWDEVPPGYVYAYAWRENHILPPNSFTVPSLQTVCTDSSPIAFDSAALQLMELLEMAVQRRIPLHTGSVAILFSGGLDSVVLAALTLKVIPPSFEVLLVNVSFVETHSSLLPDSTTEVSPQAADTLAALASYRELQQLFPQHSNLRYVPHQVDWDEIQKIESHIRALIYPKESTMDLNIATALWFAAQAATPARVLLSGLGADEQMGGYGRHRKAWNRGQDEALRNELDFDLKRLWERNLGRDDRVLSDHGTEARYPFLDTNVLSYIAALPLQLVCDFNLPPGQGDKRILRRVAEMLGVQTASSMVKRAIQFGSRISHVCDKKRYGSRRKATMGASNGLKQQKDTSKEINVE